MPITVGQPISTFSLPLLDGGTVDHRWLKGKKTLIFIWGSW